jgi:hypothetical protein
MTIILMGNMNVKSLQQTSKLSLQDNYSDKNVSTFSVLLTAKIRGL